MTEAKTKANAKGKDCGKKELLVDYVMLEIITIQSDALSHHKAKYQKDTSLEDYGWCQMPKAKDS